MPTIPKIVALQRRVAKETGCGFFDTFQAMGGEGTMAKWYGAEPRLVGADFIHPLPAGGKIVGELLFRSLQNGFQAYKLRQLKDTPPGANASKVEMLKGGDYMRVWIRRGANHYLVHFPV